MAQDKTIFVKTGDPAAGRSAAGLHILYCSAAKLHIPASAGQIIKKGSGL